MKKIALFLTLLCFGTILGFAEAWRRSAIGYYAAEYLGTEREVNVTSALNAYRREYEGDFMTINGSIKKLSKTEITLLNYALSDYETNKGEVYRVACQINSLTAPVARMIVVFKTNTEFSFVGDYWTAAGF